MSGSSLPALVIALCSGVCTLAASEAVCSKESCSKEHDRDVTALFQRELHLASSEQRSQLTGRDEDEIWRAEGRNEDEILRACPQNLGICGMLVGAESKQIIDEIMSFTAADASPWYLKKIAEASYNHTHVVILNYPESKREQCCDMYPVLKRHKGVTFVLFDVPDKNVAAAQKELADKNFRDLSDSHAKEVTITSVDKKTAEEAASAAKVPANKQEKQ
eukprot:gnl/TRDRNA2_/TRDRNA2_87609_c0_seq2.p1 gnl/TRDRNA2_/TRDRNA2_87609_c0~~gnl/TRDRNA2_/TRDRNA2_87609_c0_seq2.p1  ORF type:complete len:219 (+),score=56.50 gnl/TRDRNA2_/TRDRNA2_87609_c0_seq2:46-702(+)